MGFNDSEELVFFDSTFASKSAIEAGSSSTFDFLIPPERSNKIKTIKCIAYSD